MGVTQIKEWYNRWTLVDSEPRSGRPSTSWNDQVIAKVGCWTVMWLSEKLQKRWTLVLFQYIPFWPKICPWRVCQQIHVEVSQDVLDHKLWPRLRATSGCSPNLRGHWKESYFRQERTLWKFDESTTHYVTQMLLANRQTLLTSWKKFTHAYQGSRSSHASALHWNPPGFWKKKQLNAFLTAYTSHLPLVWCIIPGVCISFCHFCGKRNK
jgi:hypothetical protein